MEYLYKTVEKRARTELTIEKSRFITTVIPCESREEAEAFFDEIRREFKDATHNVPAFVLGNKMELKWASDDGEPQGTSGPPILKLLESKELTNIALVVTRYFGGVKLGTGGLVRAYTQSAEQAINEGGIAGAAMFKSLGLKMNYGDYNKFLAYRFSEEIRKQIIVGEPTFLENVSLDLLCYKEISPQISAILMDLTNGEIAIKDQGESLVRFALTM